MNNPTDAQDSGNVGHVVAWPRAAFCTFCFFLAACCELKGQSGDGSNEFAIRALVKAASNTVSLQITGPTGTNYYVEVSTNLSVWRAVGFEVLQSGTNTFNDRWSLPSDERFYRLLIAKDSLLQGATFFNGPTPPTNTIVYPTAEGDTLTLDGAISGWVKLSVSPFESVTNVTTSIVTNGGTILSQIPRVGLYLVQVPPGTETNFLTEMYRHWWCEAATPASSLELGSVDVFDWNSRGNSNCKNNHMSIVSQIAGRYGASVMPWTVWEDERFSEDIAQKLITQMESASINNERVVFNLSLGSSASNIHVANGSGCTSAPCENIRWQQYLWLRDFFKIMEEAKPAVANAAIITIIAGNAGVNLDRELTKLKEQFPNAFRRIQVVGGTDENGANYQNWNHLTNNTSDTMVYARARNVNFCTGTSFAAPQVTAVLDRLWSSNRLATSEQVLAAFRQAVSELGTSNILPQTTDGYTTEAFFERAGALLMTDFYPLFVSVRGSDTGGFGTVSKTPDLSLYAAGTTVTLTAVPDANSVFVGWMGACSGTGNCQVEMNSFEIVTAKFGCRTNLLVGPWQGSYTITSGTTCTNTPVLTQSGDVSLALEEIECGEVFDDFARLTGVLVNERGTNCVFSTQNVTNARVSLRISGLDVVGTIFVDVGPSYNTVFYEIGLEGTLQGNSIAGTAKFPYYESAGTFTLTRSRPQVP